MTAAADWQPGDPLYEQGQYRSYLFNFRDDNDDVEYCGCANAASWPEPKTHSALGDYDELDELIAWHHANRSTT